MASRASVATLAFFGKQFECEHTRNFCAGRRQKCLPKCLLGRLPKPSSSQSPLCSVSALRRKLHALPCSSSPHATRFAGLARGPHRLRPGANAPGLNFGTKCPKSEIPGNSKNCSPADRKMWKVFSSIYAGHIIILPPQKTRLETLANRVFFRPKCSHISLLFEMFPVAENTADPPPIRTPRTRRSFRCLLRGGYFWMRDLFHHALIGTVGKVHK